MRSIFILLLFSVGCLSCDSELDTPEPSSESMVQGVSLRTGGDVELTRDSASVLRQSVEIHAAEGIESVFCDGAPYVIVFVKDDGAWRRVLDRICFGEYESRVPSGSVVRFDVVRYMDIDEDVIPAPMITSLRDTFRLGLEFEYSRSGLVDTVFSDPFIVR